MNEVLGEVEKTSPRLMMWYNKLHCNCNLLNSRRYSYGPKTQKYIEHYLNTR